MSKLRLWHVITICSLLMLGTLLGVVLLYGHFMKPELAAPELAERTPARATETRTGVGSEPTGLLRLSGSVLTTDGEPLPATVVATRVLDEDDEGLEIQTQPDGSFSLELEGPVLLEVDDLAARPEELTVTESRDDLHFVVAARCPLEVLVLDPQGQPAEGVRVSLSLRTDQGYDRVPSGETDAQGQAFFEGTACGVASVYGDLDGYPQASKSEVDTVVDQQVTLNLVEGVAVSGFVLDLDDQPIEGARVRGGGGSEETGAEGWYELLVDPGDLHFMDASAEGYQDERAMLRLPADAESAEQDFWLAPDRKVAVYCAGMPEDSCTEIGLVMCTHPLLPFGEPCGREDPVECRCGTGEQAIRGGGAETLVGPDEDLAWLDFRDHSGAIVGRVTSEGEPTAKVAATCTFIPKSQRDLLDGMLALRVQETSETGVFAFHGLKPGTWMLELRSGSMVRSLPPVVVTEGTRDLGDIELSGGGRIEGVVLDGLTGQGKPDVPVSAVEKMTSDDPSITPKLGNSISGSEGRFMIMGLEDGDYEVFVATDPFDRVEVTVTDGASEPVEILAGNADLLEEHGFELVTEDGQLVVDAVDSSGSAAGAGLQEGDAIDSVRIFGVDPAELLPGLEDELVDALLSSYAGPGVTLVVERDGELVDVGL